MMSKLQSKVAITGSAWEIPSFAGCSGLPEAFRSGRIDTPVFQPEISLGKKGLRYKERATLLALCAAKAALANAGWQTDAGPMADTDFGVIVASNTGNLDTVCNAADTIRREHVDATSSMDLPNASSNVVASTIAIRFGLKALNLMICSGSSASFDALVMAANAIRNGRAKRMLVASVETDGLALRSLLAGRRLDPEHGTENPLLEGASAVVLESLDSARERKASTSGLLSEYAFVHADGTDRQPFHALLDRHQSKTRYLPGASFVKPLHDQAFGMLTGSSIDLGTLLDQSYGSGALLQLIHHIEQARAGDESALRGAVIAGGGSWQDRRAGVFVVEPGSALQ
jgi:3-oxoacyl-[acyl-carrier-protein] synthase II